VAHRVYLRRGGCHLSEKTRALGSSGLRSRLCWRSLRWRVGSRGRGSLLGSGRGLCGGGGRPARGRSSTLTSHFDDELVVRDRSVKLGWWWLGSRNGPDGNGELRFWSSEVFENHRR
jgi:hypothetical protein